MSAKERNLAVLKRWVQAYESDGFDGAEAIIDEVFATEVEFSPLLAREVEGRVYHGRDELRAFFRELADMLGGITYETTEFDPVGDEVVLLHTRLTGSGRGSEVPIAQELYLVYEFEDGLVRRATAYGSRAEAMAEAGENQRA